MAESGGISVDFLRDPESLFWLVRLGIGLAGLTAAVFLLYIGFGGARRSRRRKRMVPILPRRASQPELPHDTTLLSEHRQATSPAEQYPEQSPTDQPAAQDRPPATVKRVPFQREAPSSPFEEYR